MSKPLDSEEILEALRSIEEGAPPSRYLVAFSGGVDSTVLLHAVVNTRGSHGLPVLAVHVDHGLHADSGRWEAHCRLAAGRLGIDYLSQKVEVAVRGGTGLEAAAREARYGVLRSLMQPGDWLLSAHNENDQAETLLLNLFRGSGVGGLAGIARDRTFGEGRLVRPMLGISSQAILAYAKAYELEWIDDPSNRDARFDRNYLRREVLPVVTRRWPAATSRIRQSAELAGEAGELLSDLATIDLATLGSANRLQITGLNGLSGMRQRNVIRHAIRRCGLPPPPATRLYQAVEELLPARADAQPQVSWPGGELRRYRDFLYILAPLEQGAESEELEWRPGARSVYLGPGQGQLELLAPGSGGIAAELVGKGMTIRYRRGGEEIRPHGHTASFKLKKLLQQRAVVPWMRARIPLLYAGERLIAVADMWVAEEAYEQDGMAVSWQNAPALY